MPACHPESRYKSSRVNQCMVLGPGANCTRTNNISKANSDSLAESGAQSLNSFDSTHRGERRRALPSAYRRLRPAPPFGEERLDVAWCIACAALFCKSKCCHAPWVVWPEPENKCQTCLKNVQWLPGKNCRAETSEHDQTGTLGWHHR